jgi:hypothetical protein
MFIKDIEKVRGGRKLDTAQTLAMGLGAFGVALGAFELAQPGRIARWLGLSSHKPLLRGYGGRELATGVGILAARRQSKWFVWGRVAGNAADIGTLLAGLRSSRRKVNVMIALGSVAAVTALDLVCAIQLSQTARQPKQAVRDYAMRSGFPRGISASFGIAAREMREGLDWWDSWRRNLGRGGAGPHELERRDRDGAADYSFPAGRA